MSKKSKLSKVELKYLQDVADMLPKLPTTNPPTPIYQRISGASAIAQGHNETSIKKEKVDPNAFYTSETSEFMCINHFKKLKEIYTKEGEKGVDTYVFDAKAKYAQHMSKKVADKIKEKINPKEDKPDVESKANSKVSRKAR